MKINFESRDDLIKFIQEELIDTSEAAQILGCSRQNISDLIKRGKLKPVKILRQERVFFRADILARLKPSK